MERVMRVVSRLHHLSRRLGGAQLLCRTVGRTSLAALCLLFVLGGTVCAFDFGSVVRDVGNAVKSGVDTIEHGVKQVLPGDEADKGSKDGSKQETGSVVPQPEQPSVEQPSAEQPSAEQPVGSSTGTIFASEPINPTSPPASQKSFQAGERIYGMLKAAKPWKELLGSSNYLILYFSIDGKEKIYRTVGLKRQDLLDQDYFVIDIAPDPSKMTNYADRDIIFPEKDGYKFGPELFTKYLGELSPGTHTIGLQVKAYGDVYASGSFTISGSDYRCYTDLVAEIKGRSGTMTTMPRVGMVDVALQGQMLALLRNAGWPTVRRLLIVDKDWWLNRVAGGDSPIESRHIEAAAAAKDDDGHYYFCHITFLQPKLITGAWGALQIAKIGERKPILEENIDQ